MDMGMTLAFSDQADLSGIAPGLMITDAVEAASRSLHEPTPEKIKAMVRQVIQTRIADGQFEECDLSTRDIARIRETLVESLTASFHTRLQYPWQKEAEEGKKE